MFAITVKCTMFILHVLTHITNTKHSSQDTGNGLNTSNNQGIEKCLSCVLWLYNWDLHIFFGLTTYYRQKLVLLKFTIIIIIFHLVWYWIDTSMRSRPSVSVSPKWQPKLEMTWHLLIPAGHSKPSRTEKQLKNYCYLTFVILAFLLALDHQMMFFF